MSSLLLVHLAACGLSVLTADESREERDTDVAIIWWKANLCWIGLLC